MSVRYEFLTKDKVVESSKLVEIFLMIYITGERKSSRSHVSSCVTVTVVYEIVTKKST